MKFGVEIELKDNLVYPSIPGGWRFNREVISYHPYTMGNELKTPILTQSSSVQDIINVFSLIRENNPGTLVNNQCGMHVHISKDDMDQYKFIALLIFAEDHLFKLVPRHRRYNQYCRPISSVNRRNLILNGITPALNSNKESSVCNRQRFETFELRHAGSKNNKTYIKYWILLCLLLYSLHEKINSNDDLVALYTKEGFLKFLSKNSEDEYIERNKSRILNWIEREI